MDEVAAVLDREFPDSEPTARRVVHRGNHKRTTLVSFPDREVVVQVAPDTAALATEVELARAIRDRTSVPVPDVLAAGTLDAAGPRAAVGYAVLARVAGDDLHERFVALDADAQAAIARRFGGILAELHEAFAFDAFGEVHPTADGFAATGPTHWREWVTAHVDAGITALPAAFDDLRGPVRAALDDGPTDPPARLYPWDLRPGNALVVGEDLTAVLDWGYPLAADPGLAVAKCQHLVADWYVDDDRTRDRLREAFRAGYEAVRPWPTVTRAYRLAAVVLSAVDSRGEVTRPGYPERRGEAAVAFHRDRLRAFL
jgi:hypothetical protein